MTNDKSTCFMIILQEKCPKWSRKRPKTIWRQTETETETGIIRITYRKNYNNNYFAKTAGRWGEDIRLKRRRDSNFVTSSLMMIYQIWFHYCWSKFIVVEFQGLERICTDFCNTNESRRYMHVIWGGHVD